MWKAIWDAAWPEGAAKVDELELTPQQDKVGRLQVQVNNVPACTSTLYYAQSHQYDSTHFSAMSLCGLGVVKTSFHNASACQMHCRPDRYLNKVNII